MVESNYSSDFCILHSLHLKNLCFICLLNSSRIHDGFENIFISCLEEVVCFSSRVEMRSSAISIKLSVKAESEASGV